MTKSTLILGVPAMDDDHVAIDALFDEAARTPDAGLPGLARRIEAELKAHFAREEELMFKAQIPLLDCHRGQHRLILHEMAEVLKVADFAAPDLRRLLTVSLSQLVDSHVGSVDRLAAQFLAGGANGVDLDVFCAPARIM